MLGLRLIKPYSQISIVTCVVYRPPRGSKYSNDNFFDQLSSDLLDYCGETNNIILMGDFNGRIANLLDHLDLNDKNVDFQSKVLSDFRYRYNRDEENNDAGNQVLDMCKSFNLRILNGRKRGDMRGDVTHYNNAGGQSTFDLGIVSENFFSHTEKVMIFSQTELSDHCKITLQMPNMINLKQMEIVKCGFWRKLSLLPLLWHANAIDEN